MLLPRIVIDDLVRRALLEDLGHGVDVTTQSLIPPDLRGVLVMQAREDGVLAGVEVAAAAFAVFDPALVVARHRQDGARLKAGDAIVTISGNAQSILSAERVALNFMSHMSGIATNTARYVATIAGTKAAITCTRKTMPGLRAVQKYAVRMGGGRNHRFGLDDGILIKDNHIAIAGGIEPAIAAARSNAGHMVKIEVEVDTLAQLDEALNHPIDAVLLDNMRGDILREAVALVQRRKNSRNILCEASGGITFDALPAIAASGVDLISVGALTHSVQALDIGLDVTLGK